MKCSRIFLLSCCNHHVLLSEMLAMLLSPRMELLCSIFHVFYLVTGSLLLVTRSPLLQSNLIYCLTDVEYMIRATFSAFHNSWIASFCNYVLFITQVLLSLITSWFPWSLSDRPDSWPPNWPKNTSRGAELDFHCCHWYNSMECTATWY